MSNSGENPVRIYDNHTSNRRQFLKKWFSNNYDVLRFFYFLARGTKLPVVGRYFFRPVIESYYHNIHPGSYILPRKEIESVVARASHLFIDPCICRMLNDQCDTPIYTCLRINFSARVREEDSRSEAGKPIDKEAAVKIVRNARKHGAILCLENCLRPYTYNICMCCTCCCVPKQFRYQFGLDVYKNGPYVPMVDDQRCRMCKKCEKRCPVSAISGQNGKMAIDIQACLGCGVCEDTCPEASIKMVKTRMSPQRDERKPSTLNLYLKRMFIEMAITPLILVFKLVTGSQQYKVEAVKPREKDLF